MRIFIADDEAPARERLKELLGDIAAEVATSVVGEARNGVEALQQLPASGAEVVLLDIDCHGFLPTNTATSAASNSRPRWFSSPRTIAMPWKRSSSTPSTIC